MANVVVLKIGNFVSIYFYWYFELK
jgi:hypothetical protein